MNTMLRPKDLRAFKLNFVKANFKHTDKLALFHYPIKHWFKHIH